MSHGKIVNVASVPHRSPFRYPGGKTWLIPYIRSWFRSFNETPAVLIEPFAGGAIVGLTAAFENLAKRTVLVELDSDVAAVWKTIISDGHGCQLAKSIMDFELNAESARTQLAVPSKDTTTSAFQTILKNRVFHGGILAKGSSMMRAGENGKGVVSRWYPKTLSRRINDIHGIRERLEFHHDDGLKFIDSYGNDGSAVFFVDPPYTAGGKRAGSRLYNHSTIDHESLFERLNNTKGDFLMTYDNAPEVVSMAQHWNFESEPISMKNTHHAKMTELLIGRDLSWYRNLKSLDSTRDMFGEPA